MPGTLVEVHKTVQGYPHRDEVDSGNVGIGTIPFEVTFLIDVKCLSDTGGGREGGREIKDWGRGQERKGRGG